MQLFVVSDVSVHELVCPSMFQDMRVLRSNYAANRNNEYNDYLELRGNRKYVKKNKK